MKKGCIIFISLFLLTSCGNSYQSNEYLGEIPSVYMDANNEIKEAKADRMDREDLSNLVAEVRETSTEDAQSAFDEVVGDELFFSIAKGHDNPLFEIESVTIDDITPHTGALALRVKIKALKDQIANTSNDIKFFVLNNENEAIYKFHINPYAESAVVTRSQVPFEKNIKAGEYLVEGGTTFMLYCNSYDFTGYKMIMFVPLENK